MSKGKKQINQAVDALQEDQASQTNPMEGLMQNEDQIISYDEGFEDIQYREIQQMNLKPMGLNQFE